MKILYVWPDQLTMSLDAFKSIDKKDVIVMIEDNADTVFSPMHKKKIVYHWATMRHFKIACENQGYTVHYVKLTKDNQQVSWKDKLSEVIALLKVQEIVVTMPNDRRWRDDVQWMRTLKPVNSHPDNRFIMSTEEFSEWAQGKKQLIMEFFYRKARIKTGLLMQDGAPIGGKWNYDKLNQKPPGKGMVVDDDLPETQDEIVADVSVLVESLYGKHFGDIKPFCFAVTEAGANEHFNAFCDKRLPKFGDYQDAMLEGKDFMFHAVIALYLNNGLLDPMLCCRKVEQAYLSGHVPLNAAEGFIRQILGWREYIRGIYLHYMPGYKKLNSLDASRALPEFYWQANSRMKCVDEAVRSTKENAYAHHIQRLMITGNFALISGIDPMQVCNWYLAVYLDAYEWVELPNTLGMALYGDGGIVGSKPYASSGAYINKMSNYCQSCHFNVKEKQGDKACPFNVFYWDFLVRHEQKWQKNNRMKLMMTHVDRMNQEQKSQIRKQAKDTWALLNQASD